MKQLGLGMNLSTKKTRKREFLEEMERIVPWDVLVQIVERHYPKSKTGRPPFGILLAAGGRHPDDGLAPRCAERLPGVSSDSGEVL